MRPQIGLDSFIAPKCVISFFVMPHYLVAPVKNSILTLISISIFSFPTHFEAWRYISVETPLQPKVLICHLVQTKLFM